LRPWLSLENCAFPIRFASDDAMSIAEPGRGGADAPGRAATLGAERTVGKALVPDCAADCLRDWSAVESAFSIPVETGGEPWTVTASVDSSSEGAEPSPQPAGAPAESADRPPLGVMVWLSV